VAARIHQDWPIVSPLKSQEVKRETIAKAWITPRDQAADYVNRSGDLIAFMHTGPRFAELFTDNYISTVCEASVVARELDLSRNLQISHYNAGLLLLKANSKHVLKQIKDVINIAESLEESLPDIATQRKPGASRWLNLNLSEGYTWFCPYLPLFYDRSQFTWLSLVQHCHINDPEMPNQIQRFLDTHELILLPPSASLMGKRVANQTEDRRELENSVDGKEVIK